MSIQTQLKLKIVRGINLTNEEIEGLKYLLEEFQEWKKLKNTNP